jgi:hypothetical protein
MPVSVIELLVETGVWAAHDALSQLPRLATRVDVNGALIPGAAVAG